MKALIAEDNDLYRDVMEIALIEAGYKVTVTINGADALKVLEENVSDSFDLIVTDYEMPLLSGKQLIQEIMKKNIPFKRIILLTGSFDLAVLTKEFLPLKGKVFVVSKDVTIAQMKNKYFVLN